jgi:hypothetical protein
MKSVSLHVPQSGAPMETDAHARALLNKSFGVPCKGTLPYPNDTMWSV